MSQSNNYIRIEKYMITELKLSGYALLVYAIIENFSTSQGGYIGGVKFIEKTYEIRHATVSDALNKLISSGLIEKGYQDGNFVYKTVRKPYSSPKSGHEYGKRKNTVRKPYSKSTETVHSEYGNRTQNTNRILKNTRVNTTRTRARPSAEDAAAAILKAMEEGV